MSEIVNTDLQGRSTTLGRADTNEEYILAEYAKQQPPVMSSVTKAIIVETVKDFFGGIAGFFLRYIKHFVRCVIYFFNPSLHKKPFDKLDFKENTQHAFEFVIIVVALLIFMIKLEWIPRSDKSLQEVYANDLTQKVTEFFLFVIFAVAFLILAGISILLGRMFRKLFKLQITPRESDILHVYLNNAFFSIGALVTLFFRSYASTEVYDQESMALVIFLILLPCIIVPIVIWSGRMAYLHGLKMVSGITYSLIASIFYSIFYVICMFLVVAFASGL